MTQRGTTEGEARPRLRTAAALLVLVAALAVGPAAAGVPRAVVRECAGQAPVSSDEVLVSWAKVRVTKVEMVRVAPAATGFTADARVWRKGTARASVRVTRDACPDGVSNPVTVTRDLTRTVARRATARHRTAATGPLAAEQAIADAKAKVRTRMRKALVVAAVRQAGDEALDVSVSGP